MFKIDRNAAPESSWIKPPGIYSGTIKFPAEIECTPKGETKIRLEFVTESGAKATDDIINAESLWWKLNVLLAAADPDGSKINIPNGQSADFSKNSNFIEFVRKFDGLAVTFAVYLETYQKKDGSQGTATRLRPMDPRKGRTQLPAKALEQIKKAEDEAEGPDEVPF